MKSFIPKSKSQFPEFLKPEIESFDPFESLRGQPRSAILHQVLSYYFHARNAKEMTSSRDTFMLDSKMRRSLAYLGFLNESVAGVGGHPIFNNAPMHSRHYDILKFQYGKGPQKNKSLEEISEVMSKSLQHHLSIPGVKRLIEELRIPNEIATELIRYAQPGYMIPNMFDTFTLPQFMELIATKTADFAGYPVSQSGKYAPVVLNILREGNPVDDRMLSDFETENLLWIQNRDLIYRAYQYVAGFEHTVKEMTGVSMTLDGPFTRNPDGSSFGAVYVPPAPGLVKSISYDQFFSETGLPNTPVLFKI